MSKNEFDVVVFGSCMIDLLCYAPRLPKVGETIHGTNFEIGNGGKGANQCVAAAKLGASTALIARLGDDHFGRNYLQSLKTVGVNVDQVTLTKNVSSGMAQITVSEKGENQIVIVAGANNALSFEDAFINIDVLLKAKVVIFQLETPLEATLDTLKYLKNNDGPTTIFNAAPAMADLDNDILNLAHIFCVNETEAEILTGMKVTCVEEAFQALNTLLSKGCNIVVITLGAQGSVFGGKNIDHEHVPTDLVTAVDSTEMDGDVDVAGNKVSVKKQKVENNESTVLSSFATPNTFTPLMEINDRLDVNENASSNLGDGGWRCICRCTCLLRRKDAEHPISRKN